MRILNVEIKERIEAIYSGEVPEGYRKTKIGVIPEDWEVKRIGKITNVLRGASPRPISDPKWFDEDSSVGWVRISDVSKSNKILLKTEQYLSKKGIQKSRLVKKNNIIMSICATVGRPIYTGFDVCIHDGFVVFDKLSVDKEFFYYMLLNKEKFWHRYGQTGSQMNLNTNIVSKERIVIPTETIEQQKIAQILSAWDKAIELKEKLIEEKKKQKKGLMQKLLTGEVRLPGFDGEWEEVRLGEILKERNETGYETLELLAITGSRGIVKRDEVDIKDTSSEDKSKYKRIMPLDIGYNTMRMWQGVSGVSKYEGIVSPAYTVLKPTSKIDSFFIGYLFKTPKVINLFKRYSQGLVNDTLNLKYNNFKKIKLFIPKSIHEQKAIAQILSTADKEIELLEKELEQLKLQKKGLMQLLLTGIIRVKS